MKKFRDMIDSEKLVIINAMIAGDPLEISCNGGTWYDSKECNPFVVIEYYYRIPHRPMSIDWSVLKDEFICAKKSSSGTAKASTGDPSTSCAWKSIDIDGLKSYDPGTVDWTESLIWRPGFEQK